MWSFIKYFFIPVVLILKTVIMIGCLTIDPEPPERLGAPVFSHYSIVAKKDLDDEYNEFIQLHWRPDSTDKISIGYFEIIRMIPTDSTSNTNIRNIPGNYRLIHDKISNFNLLNPRTQSNNIFYKIFAIDSLERAGDTSIICTVSLAENVILKTPFDTLHTELFQWIVPQIFTQSITNVLLWKNDSLLWESDSIPDYTGGGSKNQSKILPGHLSPLQSGMYYWGVKMTLVSGGIDRDPSSITIREFYVK
ncbi:MAG: hypothetical protein PVI26_00630 [Chitinispirillia bacterium]|jgi:hypothetical protein